MIVPIVILFITVLSSINPVVSQVEFWLTTSNKSSLLQPQHPLTPSQSGQRPMIDVNPQNKFQDIDGFGWCLTGGSASVIYSIPNPARHNLLQELFDNTGNNIGTSFLRLTIGASDMSESVFTYDDIPEGQTDPNLSKFSLGPDLQYVVPLLKEILQINPNIKLLGSPWTAPNWMKTKFSAIGGSLSSQSMGTYANYFVKYVQEMNKNGIPIYAITPQNEPLNPNNNPSLYMESSQQKDFIKNHLGPAFKNAGVQTKIIVYDHNADRIDYPMDILSDSVAASYVDGSAFHLYAGQMSALSTVHQNYPQKGIYFTEQWTPAPENDQQFSGNLNWAVKNLIIDGTRNWCKAVIQWNLATDQNWQPHTCCGGCTTCLGAITVSKPSNSIKRNSGYYAIAHASKFVESGSVRVESSSSSDLSSSAFVRKDGKLVIVVVNSQSNEQVTIRVGNLIISPRVPQNSIATFIWPASLYNDPEPLIQ